MKHWIKNYAIFVKEESNKTSLVYDLEERNKFDRRFFFGGSGSTVKPLIFTSQQAAVGFARREKVGLDFEETTKVVVLPITISYEVL